MDTKTCEDCGKDFPTEKFNLESFSPHSCFRCRVSGVRFGFVAGRESFHGTSLVGGTIASDNRHTISEAKSNGFDPVPLNAPGIGVSSAEMNRLKKIHQR